MPQFKNFIKIYFKGFTIIELLVAVAIIGLIGTFSFIVFSNTYKNSRDSRRASDVMKIQQALERYRHDVGYYPDTLASGTPLMNTSTNVVYMDAIPSNPSPRNESGCADSDYTYIKNQGFDSYIIYFCLASKTGNLPAGVNTATPNGIFQKDSVYDGLLSWWRFDEAPKVPSRDHGKSQLNLSVSSHFLEFGGNQIPVGDYSQFNFSNSFSISTWVNAGTRNATNGIVSKYIVSPSSGWSLSMNGGVPNLSLGGTSSLVGSLGAPDLRDGTFHHIATIVTKATSSASTTIDTLVDGSLVNTVHGNWVPVSPIGAQLVIGGSPDTYNLVGDLLDLRIYNRALSSAEIKAIYNFNK